MCGINFSKKIKMLLLVLPFFSSFQLPNEQLKSTASLLSF